MFEAVEGLLGEHAELEQRLADPSLHTDPAAARRVGRRYAELQRIIATYRDWQATHEDARAARELAADDPGFAGEAEQLDAKEAELAERLQMLLLPRDPSDHKDVIIEVKAGEGGAESALFAADLLRMYERHAERRGYSTEVLDIGESELGGYKNVTLAVKAKPGTDEAAAPYARLKFEGGVHRVQRVPVTESQGRIHTSAAGVLVFPEADEVDVTIEEKDLRIDAFRSSGPGGQSVNTTDSAIRITHEPTGIVVSCQNEKSQLQNRAQAMRILRARLLAAAQEEVDRAVAETRRSQIRTVDRSERVRTYNFPQSRITDHRVGYTAYNLEQALDGDLDTVIQALVDADTTERLASVDAAPRQ